MTSRSIYMGLIVAGLFVLFVGVGPARAAEECISSQDLPYDIDLDIDTPSARLHHDLSIAQLGRMSFHGVRSRILGLASTALDFGWQVSFDSEPKGDGYCFWVESVKLTVRYPPPDIYVAREYRRGSCPYRKILAHEQAHVANAGKMILRYIPRLRWVLTSLRIPTGQRQIFVDSRPQAKTAVRALMQDLTESLYREMAEQLAKAQAELDSPASYRRLFKQCRNW